MITALNSKLILSAAVIFTALVLIIGATFAFFSDTETSENNSLVAGALDLKIDNESYYNGVLNQGTTWTLDDLTDQLFFDFNDVKPGDLGEDTISLHAENDAWVCAEFSLTENNDNTCTEPEVLDDLTCAEPNGNLFDGELAQNVNFAFWTDDGDNVLETAEEVFASGSANQVLNNNTVTLADSLINNLGEPDGASMAGGVTHYIGKAWCFGTLTQSPLPQDGVNNLVTPVNTTGGVTCNGTSLNNATQTDKLLADIKFSAVQSRNNPDFVCSGQVTPTPTPSTTPSTTPTPTPLACTQADVMLVLDRSGSISSTELAQLKTAAKDFVDSLGLTPAGVHAGQTSFSTTGTLDHILTSNSVTLKAAVDALSAGGFTNLKSGIDLATGELGGGNDRPDLTSPDAQIIVTDGNPNRPLPSSTADDVAKASADTARAAGIEVFVVGVGADVNAAYLQTVADDAAHYYSVADYSGLQTTLQNIDLCD